MVSPGVPLDDPFVVALKEAKVHTTWTNPNAEYDGAMRRFVARERVDLRGSRPDPLFETVHAGGDRR